MRAWTFWMAAVAMVAVGVWSSFASMDWGTYGAPLLVWRLLPAWAVGTGLLALTCFAIGAPAAGLALWLSLLGAVLGAEVFAEYRQPWSAALGATAGTVIGGLLGFVIRPRVDPCLPGVMRVIAFVAFFGGAVAWIVLRIRLDAVNAPCRDTSLGLTCHLDAIVAMAVIDLAIVAVLLLLAARRCPDG